MERNQKAFVGAQLREFQKLMEGNLQQLINQLNAALGQLNNSLQSSVAAINTLTIQQEAMLDQLVEAGTVDKDRLEKDMEKKFEEENARREEMITQMQKQQEAMTHAENNAELEESIGEDSPCRCGGCGECELEAQFEPEEQEEVEVLEASDDPVLASEKSNVVKFPNQKEE